jgi:hypothetical protein
MSQHLFVPPPGPFVFLEEKEVPLLRVLTGRGTEYCGAREHHEYQLYPAVENIDHSRTKARHPQTNGICERFHKTLQDEFYSTAFRKTLYTSLEQLQTDLDLWIEAYNHNRPHSGKYCFGKTPLQTFLDSRQLAWDKIWIGRLRPLWPSLDDLVCQIKFWLLHHLLLRVHLTFSCPDKPDQSIANVGSSGDHCIYLVRRDGLLRWSPGSLRGKA